MLGAAGQKRVRRRRSVEPAAAVLLRPLDVDAEFVGGFEREVGVPEVLAADQRAVRAAVPEHLIRLFGVRDPEADLAGALGRQSELLIIKSMSSPAILTVGCSSPLRLG